MTITRLIVSPVVTNEDQANRPGLKKLKEKYTQELQELNKSKPKDKGDEGLLENLARLNAQLGVSRDSLVCPPFQYAADYQKELQSRLSDLKGELKAKTTEIEKLSPDLKSKSKAVDAIDTKVDKLESTVDAADDGVFKAFCKKIKVASIREYEDVQLKMMSEENEKMAEFVVQQNRIGHQYVSSC